MTCGCKIITRETRCPSQQHRSKANLQLSRSYSQANRNVNIRVGRIGAQLEGWQFRTPRRLCQPNFGRNSPCDEHVPCPGTYPCQRLCRGTTTAQSLQSTTSRGAWCNLCGASSRPPPT